MPLATAPYLDGLAQDSAFVHARNMYEFLVEPKGEGASIRTELGLPKLSSSLWVTYGNAVHRKALHMSRWRPHEPAEPGRGPFDDLQDRVADFAHDGLRLWDLLADTKEAQPYRRQMTSARRDVIEHTAWLAGEYGLNPLFR